MVKRTALMGAVILGTLGAITSSSQASNDGRQGATAALSGFKHLGPSPIAEQRELYRDLYERFLERYKSAQQPKIKHIEARIKQIEAVLKADQADIAGSVTVLDGLNNSIIASLRSQYLALSKREADWSAKYGKNHSALANLRNQMRELRRSIRDELTRMLETYKSEIANSRRAELWLKRRLELLRKRERVPCLLWRNDIATPCDRRSKPKELWRNQSVDELTRLKKTYESEYAIAKNRANEVRRQLQAAERREKEAKQRLERLMKGPAELP